LTFTSCRSAAVAHQSGLHMIQVMTFIQSGPLTEDKSLLRAGRRKPTKRVLLFPRLVDPKERYMRQK
jgi:hypothetical protein